MAVAETAARRRVVLLSYHFPPTPEVGGLRAAKVARALRRAGHEVIVVTGRLPDEGNEDRPNADGVRIITVPLAWNPRQWYASLKQRVGALKPHTASADQATEAPAYAVPARVPFWKRAIFSLLWLPDDFQGFIGPAVRAARSQLRPGDIVYTTAPPFSAHLAGLRLASAKYFWVAEFRDPWTDILPWKPSYIRTAFTDALERRFERRTLSRANLVVGVSDGITRMLRRKVEGADTRLLLVRNGIDTVLPPKRPKASGPFRLIHVGTFYLRRDPRPFLAGLALLRDRRGLTGDQLQVDFVGQCKWFHEVSVEQEVRRQDLTNMVRFHDWIPHAECQRLITEADALLLLAMDQPDQVPNKLYEYLGTRIPVLALADDEGESALMLRQGGGNQVVTDEDPHSVAEALEALLDARGTPAGGPVLEEWTVERQMARLVEALEGLQ